MSLGPSNPVWRRLYDALSEVARRCGGVFAFVIDEGNGLWCVGLPGQAATTLTGHEDRAADRFYEIEMVPRMSAMRRGVRLDIAKNEGNDRYLAVSFAGIYAVVVWFEAAFEPALVRARVRRALPEIEALTLALPPSGGPSTDAGAAKIRA